MSQRKGAGNSTSRLYAVGLRLRVSLERLGPIVEGLEIKKLHGSWAMPGESPKTKRNQFTPQHLSKLLCAVLCL